MIPNLANTRVVGYELVVVIFVITPYRCCFVKLFTITMFFETVIACNYDVRYKQCLKTPAIV